MKKLNILLVILLFTIGFVSCEKEPDSEEQPDLTPSLIASADPEVVERKGSSKVNYKGENLDSLYCNGERLLNLKGDFTLTNIKKDTSFIFVGYYTTIIDGGGTKADIVEVRTLTVKVDITVHFDPPEILSLSYEAWNPYANHDEDIIYYGDQAQILLSLSGSVDSTYMNGARVKSWIVGPLKSDSLFRITVYGPGGMIKDSIVVPIVLLDEDIFNLTQNYWKAKEMLNFNEITRVWDTVQMDLDWYTLKYFYNPHGMYRAFKAVNPNDSFDWDPAGLGSWEIFDIGDESFFKKGEVYKIIKLTPTYFCYEDEADGLRLIFEGVPNDLVIDWGSVDPPYPYH